MRHIFIIFIIFKLTNCVRTKDMNGTLRKSNIVKVTADGEIYVATGQDIHDDEVKVLLEEKFRFFNDNTSRRYKTMDSDDHERDGKVDITFRAIPERRIIGGMQTSIRMYPYNVAISRNGKHWCGGSIIDEQWVLTAGHCMESAHDGDKKKLNPYIVRAGSSFHSKGGYQARINKVFFPKEFAPGHADYDFSLARLDRPMPIGRNIAVVNLPSKKYKLVPDDMLVVTGWGSTDVSGVGSVPQRLRFVPVPVMSPLRCQDSYHFYITPRMVCAGYKGGGKDACNHDSGGPAMRDGVLLGVVSFGGKKCGDPRSPGVYSKVSVMTDWVEKTIANNEANSVPELQKKIKIARQREGELQTFKMQLENKKAKIKKWLRKLLQSSQFIEKAKKKLEEVGIDILSPRRKHQSDEDDDTLDDNNLTNLITERVFEEDISDEKDTLLRILALYEMTSSDKQSLISFTQNMLPIFKANESELFIPQS